MYKHSKRQKERDKLKKQWEALEKLQAYEAPNITLVEERKITIVKKGLYVDEKV